MLMTQRAYNEAGRAFALYVGLLLDQGKYGEDAQAHARSELLTPVAKAYFSDRGFDGAVMAQQVFGGHGYVQEWGVEQVVRDARIAQIYEGTNGVQALDLIGRKVLRDGGVTLRKFIDDMGQSEVAGVHQADLQEALDRLVRVTGSVIERSAEDPNLPGAVSTDFLELFGLTIYAWLWARMAHVAPADDFGDGKRVTAQFFFNRILPASIGLEQSILSASDAVMGLTPEQF
jgi:hypothetical protein